MINSWLTAVSSGNKHVGRQDMTCPDVTQPAGPSPSFVCEKRVWHIGAWLMWICSHSLHKYCLFPCVWESQSGWQSCLRMETTVGCPLAFFPAAVADGRALTTTERWPKKLKATVKVVNKHLHISRQEVEIWGKEVTGLSPGRLLKSSLSILGFCLARVKIFFEQFCKFYCDPWETFKLWEE